MYSRQTADGRHSRNINIPANYSGSAFRENEAEDIGEAEAEASAEPQKEETVAVTAPVAVGSDRRETESAGLFRLFGSGSGGIGFEELLILGLVFLISQNDTKDDLAFLLLLLLFIK